MQVKPNTSKNIIKIGGVAAAGLIPAVYMTKLHMDMFKKEDKENRAIMRNKMIGFFSGIGLAVMLAHKSIRVGNVNIVKSDNGNFSQAIKLMAAIVAPFAGLFAAKVINKELYPDKFILGKK